MFYSKGKKRTLNNFKQKSKFALQEDQTSGSVKDRLAVAKEAKWRLVSVIQERNGEYLEAMTEKIQKRR